MAAVAITAAACRFDWPERTGASAAISVSAIGSYLLAHLLVAGALPMPETVHLLAQTVLAWVAWWLLRRAARLCDALIEHVAQRRLSAAATQATQSADRAHLAMLHDTASTTFLMVSTDPTGDLPWLRRQAARDLDLLTSQAESSSHPESSNHKVDLAALLSSLRGHQGLEVHVDMPSRLLVPARQAFAVFHGVREGLTNVRRHSGDDRPRLSATRDDTAVVVELADRGRGFDPGAVPDHRQGLTSSIHARAGEAGACAVVRSAAGEGTTVTWTWPT